MHNSKTQRPRTKAQGTRVVAITNAYRNIQVKCIAAYNFLVSPNRIFPMALVKNILSQDIPANMLAIRQRAEEIFGSQ